MTRFLSILALVTTGALAQNPISCGNNTVAANVKNSVQFYRIGETTPIATTTVSSKLTSLACDALGGFAVGNDAFLQLPVGGTEISYPVTSIRSGNNTVSVTLIANAAVSSNDGELRLSGTFAIGGETATLFIDPRQGNLLTGRAQVNFLGFCPTNNTQIGLEQNTQILTRVYQDTLQFAAMRFGIAPGPSYKLACSTNAAALVFNNNGQTMLTSITDDGTPFTATLGQLGAATSVAVANDGIYFTTVKTAGRIGATNPTTNIYKVVSGIAKLEQTVAAQAVVLSVSGELTIFVPTSSGWSVYNSGNLQ